MPRPIILIQGQEFSQQEKLESLLQGKNIKMEGTLTFEGIDTSYPEMVALFDNPLFKFFSISGNNTKLTREGVKEFLQQAKSSITSEDGTPLVMIAMHGTMASTSNVAITPHVLQLMHTPSVFLLTSFLFKIVSDCLQCPVELVLFSCQSGSAIKSAHLLPKGSKLVTYSNDQQNILTSTMVESTKYLISHGLDDISAYTMLQGYFLNTDDKAGCQNVSISISGKKPFSFADFCQNCSVYPMSSDQLLNLYQEYEKFGLRSPIKALLENGNSKEAFQAINERHKQLQEFQKVFTEEVYNDGGEEACNAAAKRIINPDYGVLEDAIYHVINNPPYNNHHDEWEYCAFVKGYKIEAPDQVSKIKLSILLSLYAQQETVNIDIESLKGLYDEIIFLAHLPEGSNWKLDAASFFDTIQQNTDIKMSQARDIWDNTITLPLPNTDSGTLLGQSLDIASNDIA